MRPLVRLIAAGLAGIVFYGLLFGFVIHKPLTIGEIPELLWLKETYARQAASPKLVIFAGSNARFSHSCRMMEPIIGMPCVNFGIARGIALDFLFAELEPLLRPGDVVYMPLEYDWYLDDKVAAMTGPDASLMLYSDKLRLVGLGPERTIRAFFSFDLAFAASGLAEMALHALRVQRRVGIQTMTAEGDEQGHTPEEGEPYRAYVEHVQPPIPTAAAISRPSYAKEQIAIFLEWCRQRGITVYGGLQTTFADAPITLSLIAAIQRFYVSHGQQFLLLPSHSQFPRSCFFDTFAHLNEPCQIAHSIALAHALAATFPGR